MSTVLQRFKTWIFESHSFVFSWYTKDSNQLQVPTKTLVELPPSIREKLIAATNKLSDNPTDTQVIRSCIDEAFEQWRDRPQKAENSIVILTSPVMVVSRIIITILENWTEEKQISVKVLPWNERPADANEIQSKLQQYLEQESQETAEETKELLTKITTFKVTQALMIILSCYVTLRIIDWSIIWVSERIAREWRLRVKQLLPFFRTVVLTTTIITLMNLFLNLSPENILAVTGAAAVALGFAFKDFASSIIAGIVGIFEGSYRVGDRIKIGEVAQLEYDLCDAPLLLNFKKLKAYGLELRA